MKEALDLLDRLARAGGEAVSVDLLAAELGVGPEALERRVASLREDGYVIERVPLHGSPAFRLLEVPDRLAEPEVARSLRTRWIGRRELRCVPVCASTNDLARDLARGGAPSGALVTAEEQTAGRGRGGRRWHSPPGLGIYLSLVYRPPVPLDSAALLQVTTGVAVAHAAMRVTARTASLRWPNDVLVQGRKLAGLLVEAQETGSAREAYVVGVGLNVNQRSAEEFPEEIREEAVSLAMAAGRKLSRLAVLGTLLDSLEEWYARMEEGDTEAVGAAWRPLSSLLGEEVELVRGDRKLAGRVTDLCPVRGILLDRGPEGSEWIPPEHVRSVRPAASP